MADYRILIEAETAKAEKDLRRVETVADAAARDRKINFSLPNLSGIAKAFGSIDDIVEDSVNNIKKLYNILKMLPGGIGDDIKGFENVFQTLARGAGMATAAFMSNNTAGKMLGGVFSGVSDTVQTLVQRLAMVGFAMNGLNQVVGVLKGAFGGFFNETVGREIKLRETMLSTQTAVASLSKVFVGGREITDPLQKIEALGGAVEARIESIRERSLDLAGVTSSQVIDVFNITATQIGQIGGGLKDAEDLAISFSAALGTFGIPLFQAQQEITSILTGTIDMNSRLAKSLGITNEKIAKAKTEAGGVMKYLQDVLKTAVAGQKLQAQTWSGVTSNLKELQELVAQKFGKGLLDPMLSGLSALYNWLSSIKLTLFGIAEQAGKTLGAIARVSTVKLTTGLAGLQGSPVTTNARISEAFKSGAESLKTVSAEVFSWLTKAANYAVNAIISAFNALKPSLALIADSVRVLIKAFAEIKTAQFEGLVSSLANVISVLSPLIGLAAGFVRAWAGVLDLPIVQYFSTVKAQLDLFKRAGGDALISLVGIVMFLKSTAIPVLQTVITVGINVIRGIASAIASISQLNISIAQIVAAVSQAVAVGARGLSALLGSFRQVGQASQAVGTDIGVFARAVADVGKSVGAMSTAVSTAFKELQAAGTTASTSISQGLSRSIDSVRGAVGGLVATFTQFGSGSSAVLTNLRAAFGQIGSALSQLVATTGGAFRSILASIGEVLASISTLGQAFLGLKASVAQLVGSIIGPIIAIGRVIGQVASQLITALVPVFAQLEAAFAKLGQQADALAAKLRTLAQAGEGAKQNILGMVWSFAKGALQFAAIQLAIGMVIDLFGRFQRAMQDAAAEKEGTEALKYLETNAIKAAQGLDKTTKALHDYKKAIAETNREKVIKDLAEKEADIKKQKELLSRPLKTMSEQLFGFRMIGEDSQYMRRAQRDNLAALESGYRKLSKQLEYYDRVLGKIKATEAQTEASSTRGRIDSIQKQLKVAQEIAALQSLEAQNSIKQLQLAGLLNEKQAQRAAKTRELRDLTAQLEEKQKALVQLKGLEGSAEEVRKLSTEIAGLQGKQIEIQLQLKKDVFDQQVAELAASTQKRLAILTLESTIAQNNLNIAQARNSAEGSRLNYLAAIYEYEKQNATSAEDQLAFAEQLYIVKLQQAENDYQLALLNIDNSLRQIRIEYEKTRIKELELQITVNIAKAQGLLTDAHLEALKAAKNSTQLAAENMRSTEIVAGYQKEAAEWARKTAIFNAEAALRSERVAYNSRITAQNNAIAANNAQRLAENLERANRARGAGGGAPSGQNPPRYAAGGYITRPTLGLIGEGNEPEFVIPQSKMFSASARFLAGARGEDVLNGAAPTSSSNNPTINVRTGPVLEFNGERYVTLADMERAMRATANGVIGRLRSPSARVALGMA